MNKRHAFLESSSSNVAKSTIGILNVNGFYDDLLSLIQNMVDKGFISEANKQILLVSESIVELLEMMKSYQPPTLVKVHKDDNVST